MEMHREGARNIKEENPFASGTPGARKERRKEESFFKEGDIEATIETIGPRNEAIIKLRNEALALIDADLRLSDIDRKKAASELKNLIDNEWKNLPAGEVDVRIKNYFHNEYNGHLAGGLAA